MDSVKLTSSLTYAGRRTVAPSPPDLRAVAAEHTAACVVRGVKSRCLVYASPDIAIGHWFRRKLALPYELAMRRMNREFDAVGVQRSEK